MAEIVRQIAHRGVAHEYGRPTLEMQGVTVAYAAGVNGVTTTRGTDYALKDVSFQVGAGERIAVVGPNGAGKSTLFKLIVGTLKPSQGEVTIFGHGPAGHICIAYVPQRSQIDWGFPVTVEDVVMMGRVGQIGFFRWPRRGDWAVVRRSLERVGAAHLAHKQIGELSGGQQQRVFVARALAQEAELLLLDEPLTGLDLPSQEAIFEILDGLRPDGVTVLVATHDLNLAAERFDRVMLLNRKIVALGAATAVLTTDNLLAAYGGHMTVLNDGDMLLADTCCDHD
ncbi:MAG: metal ABC transporter ATP-binding protein [Chloroflexi bacterium]|nr:metal ABC transporter ATP-binding protein [Chloroflexota bacterium]MBP7045095.1 metal ABC transporter ATP-binding protein [Chloroflexota bacterium]